MVDVENKNQGKRLQFSIEYGEIVSGDIDLARFVAKPVETERGPGDGYPDYLLAADLFMDFYGKITRHFHKQGPPGRVY